MNFILSICVLHLYLSASLQASVAQHHDSVFVTL